MFAAALACVVIILAIHLACPLAQQSLPLDLQKRNSTGCLPRFLTDRAHFEPCKKNICFLFISDELSVVLSPDMEKQNNQTLFRCRDRAKVFPGLSGFIFQIKDQLPLEHSLCVFAGTQCAFNNMVDFVAEHSTLNEGYQFAVSGLMYLLPNRIANRTFPTVPLMEGKIVILGPRDQSAPVSIFQPFRGDAWVTLAVVLVLISLLSVLKFCLSTKDHSFYNYVRSLFGDLSDSIIPSQNGGEQSSEEQEWWRGLQEKSRLVNKVAGTTTGLALAAFLTISILCYEIAIVNFAFVQQAKHLGKDIQNLTPRELSKYIVMANAAHETVWRKLVDPEGRYAEVPVPWRRCGKANECFRKLLDKNHPAIYYVTQNINVRYQLRQRNLCNTHTVYNTKRPIFPSYWGWYFGANVPVDVRVRVNRAITTLSLEGKLRQIITHVGEISDELDCGEPNRSIGVETVGPMIALVVGSFVLVACIALLKGWVIQRLAGRGYKGPAVAKDS